MRLGLGLGIGGAGRSAFPSPVRLSTPASLGNLSCWLDAQASVLKSGSVPATALNDVVATWPDQSGNGKNGTTVTGSPTYDPTGINGFPCVQLSGTSYLKVATLMTAPLGSAMSVYIAAKTNSGSMAAEQLLVGVSTPSFWIAPTTTGLDVTMTGVTGNPATTTYDTPDGIYSLVLGSTSARALLNRLGHNASSGSGLNGSLASNGVTITGSIAFTGQDLTVGALTGGTFKFDGKLGELLVFNAAHTFEQQRQVMDYLSNKWGFNIKPIVICFGNSLTSGTNSTGGAAQSIGTSGTNFPSRLLNAAGATYTVRTDAYPGRTTAQLIAETPTYGDKYYWPTSGAKHIALVWEITNTLAGTQSPNTAYSQLVALCQQKRAWGFKVIVATCLNRQDAGTYAGFDTDRQAVNARILANYPAFADAVLDVAANANLSDPTNTTYFGTDKTHLTNAGYQIVSDLADPVVRALL